MAEILLKIYDTENNVREYNKISEIDFTADRMKPYTELYIKAVCNDIFTGNISRITVEINKIKIHDGFCDSMQSFEKNGCCFIVLRSKSFTALLEQNFLKPQLYSDISFNELMENYVTLPYVTHENNDTKSYVYVTDDKSMWESVTTLGYKICGTYPYITECNKVNISIQNENSVITLTDKNILESGTEIDYKTVLSDVCMQDAAGEYEKYSAHSTIADKLNIKRKKQMPLDMQFLNAPEKAPEFRLNFENAPIKFYYLKCCGFWFADIYYKLTCESFAVNNRNILKINVHGNSQGLFTYYYFV